MISSFIFKKTTFFNKPIIVHIQNEDLYLDLEDYVIGVVSAEMPALFEEEALKAQAIVSRSFAVSKMKDNLINISGTISDQVYEENYKLYNKWKDNYDIYYNKISSLVLETKNMVLKRDNKVLKTYYFSMSNGKTEDSISVFNEDTIKGVDSPYENESLKNFKYTTTISKEEIKTKLNIDTIIIQDIIRNNSGRVDYIEISNQKIKGTEFRKLFNLRSTDFDISFDNDNYIITTRGYGHGVGMSQYGANLMAQNGYNYKQILNHYYLNSYLSEI